MGDVSGFLKLKRKVSSYRPVCERVKDYRNVSVPRTDEESREQASRCMDCGTPFCHWGCPVGNYIPEWNDFAFSGNWQKAFDLLDATNTLPEITGRVCPALCESACVLGINDDPVTIKENELAVIEYAFSHGLITPRPPKVRTGFMVAVVGSGPAGLSSAAELNRMGHDVVVFERDMKPGGILRYGIPDFKLEKWILDRRIKLLEAEGIKFVTSVDAGKDYAAEKLFKDFDAVCVAIGCRTPRDLRIEGRDLEGIHMAMDYLSSSNRYVSGEASGPEKMMNASGKKVVVIGGGDTGSDCVGTAIRQGASCVTQIELLPKPPGCRTETMAWPKHPMILRTSSSHEEGGCRMWSVLTKKFIGSGGRVRGISCEQVEFGPAKDEKGCPIMKPVSGSGIE
ncbi:MAG: glutamate synthase subunit beta, partial [Candidatus Omnitrophica bacterium]|nr:glutamate synthase subunit beta [Candidatus Omnitrophota bacterium]